MRYLNFILTVIAILLAYQCVRDTAAPALAQTTGSGPIPVKIMNYSIEAVPVKIQSVSALCDPLPVKGPGASYSVPVVIKER